MYNKIIRCNESNSDSDSGWVRSVLLYVLLQLYAGGGRGALESNEPGSVGLQKQPLEGLGESG